MFNNTITTVLLIVGCGLIGFSPIVSILFLIILKKSQLVIVATSGGFFFILSSTISSLLWLIFYKIGFTGPISVLLPGILSQFLCRCSFVHLYHKVESVIQLSLYKHNLQQSQNQQQNNQTQQQNNNTNNDDNNNNDNNGRRYKRNGNTTIGNDSTPTDAGVVAGNNNNNNNNNEYHTSSTTNNTNNNDNARLRLELNDAVSAIAAAGGYGGMHAILFYGTLLAKQTSNIGILYQQSCPLIPSLVVSGIFTFCFSILDIFWMLFTFFGMRRRLLYPRNNSTTDDDDYNNNNNNRNKSIGGYFGNSRNGGNVALLVTLITHIIASMVTIVDYIPNGCIVSIPCVIGVVLVTMYLFYIGCGRIYMPPPFTPPPPAPTSSIISSTQRQPVVTTTTTRVGTINSITTATNDYHEA